MLFGVSMIVVGAIISAIFFYSELKPKFEFQSYRLKSPLETGPQNFILDKAELFISRPLLVPESIAIRGNDIYTGENGGKIYRINSDTGVIKQIASYEYPCLNTSLEMRLGNKEGKKCSYPLGLRFDPNNEHLLYFTDPYKGILRLNLDTGITEVVVDMADPIEGKYPLVPEDLDVTKDGIIYWTDGSTTGGVGNFHIDSFVQPSGRLLKYDPKLNKSVVLMDRIHFSNGVQLAADESFVLISETFTRRILRYYIKGDKVGQSDIFIDGLPGYPDNVRDNGKGGFYIALPIPRNNNYTLISESLSEYPLVRRGLIRLRYFLQELIYFIALEKSAPALHDLYTWVGHFGPLFDYKKWPKVGLVLEVDGNGNLIKLLQSSEGKMEGFSQFTVGKDYAYTSTPLGTNIWRIKISDL